MLRKSIFLAYFFICADGFAQQYPFVYYTPNDGLVNSRVRNIKQDNEGRIYFITYGGLSVYDGARFTNYGQQEGLANELVNDIAEVAPDSLLVATNTDKLNTLVHGKIGVYKTANNFSPLINRFLKSSDGNWYVTTDNGFFLLAGNKFIRLPFTSNKGNNLGLFLDQFIEWKNFFLIIPWKAAQNQTLILYDRITRQVADVYYGGVVESIVKDRLGHIWISTPEGIRLIDTEKLQNGKIKFIDLPSRYDALKKLKNVSLFFDSENNLWLYKNDLIEKISPQLQQDIVATGRSLKAGTLLNMFEDREGIIWIASDGNGAIKIKGTNLVFLNEMKSFPLQASAIQTEGDTTWLFNGADNSFYRFYKNSIQVFALVTKISSPENIYLAGNKILLSGEKKIMVIEDKNKPASYQHPKVAIENSEQGLSFGYGVIDKYGSVIQLLNKNDSAFYLAVIRNDKMIMKQRIENITDQFAIDKTGKLWLATRGNHLMVFTIHPDQPLKYLQLLKDYSAGLPFANPRSLAIDTNNNIWVGTRNKGILEMKFDGSQIHSFNQFTTRDGLTDNFIYALHIDEKNNVWVGTQTGLDKLFLKDGHYIISNISRSNNFFQTINKIVTNDDLTAWALTNEGSVFKISPILAKQSAPPPVLINLLKVNDRPINNSIYRFSYNENNFLFSVAAASFTDERAIRYSYLLTGSGNNKWSDPSNNANLNFLNLSPGNYTLHVKAEFPDAMYSEQENSFSFIIIPPWWQTWWFRVAALIIAAFLIIYLISAYVKRKLERQRLILEKQQAIEKERTRIATDMHDDLGAGLSRIKFLSETIGIKKQKQEPIEEDISKIREYSHEMIDKMGEIVWALNEKNDSLSDLLSYTRSYAVEYLSQNGIICSVEAPEIFPSNFVTGEFRRNIFLTIKEALHNVVKHSQANHATMKIIITNQLLQISIEDDGVGFDKNKIRPFSNGLFNMEKRIKEIDGILTISGEKGTTVHITAPLKT